MNNNESIIAAVKQCKSSIETRALEVQLAGGDPYLACAATGIRSVISGLTIASMTGLPISGLLVAFLDVADELDPLPSEAIE